jgi:transposase
MRAYSNDLRQRVVAAYDAREGTQEQVAARFADLESRLKSPLPERSTRGSDTSSAG